MKKTNVKQISRESAATRGESDANRILYVPYLRESLDKMKYKFAKGDTQKWIPVACSLLVRPEFAEQSPQTRYVFMAILLLCGTLGTDEISANTKYLSYALAADERMIAKSLEELLVSNLLTEQNKKEQKRTEQNTTEQTRAETPDAKNVVVCDFSKSFKTGGENQNQEKPSAAQSNSAADGSVHLSQFTLKECLSYVQLCVAKGDAIKNPHGLATSLFQTGKSDAFIRAAMFPEDQKQSDLENYGAPVQFSAEPCSVCFGARMSDVDGKGYRKCQHCKDERGKSTGLEPKGNSE